MLKGGSESAEVSVSDLQLVHGAVEVRHIKYFHAILYISNFSIFRNWDFVLGFHLQKYCAGLKQSADKQNEETGKKIMDLYKQMTECMDENKTFKSEMVQSQIGIIKESMKSAREALEMELMKMEETVQTSKAPVSFVLKSCI